MKKLALSLITLFVVTGFSYGQDSDQNPNYQKSLNHYTKELETTVNTMGTTVQETYKAIDEWQDRKDKKLENKRLAIEYRHQRRMARINNNSNYFRPSIYGNYSLGYCYGNNFSLGYGYRNNFSLGYNYGNNFYSRSPYYHRNRFPINYRIGGTIGGPISVGIGTGNCWFGF